jgi:hypothetical protein
MYSMTFALRTKARTEAMRTRLQRHSPPSIPNLPMYNVRTMTDLVSDSGIAAALQHAVVDPVSRRSRWRFR